MDRYLSTINWNLRNLCRCAENVMIGRTKGGSPMFWEREARRMDLESIMERN